MKIFNYLKQLMIDNGFDPDDGGVLIVPEKLVYNLKLPDFIVSSPYVSDALLMNTTFNPILLEENEKNIFRLWC